MARGISIGHHVGETERGCRLEAALGRHAPCRAGACPFWEPGGAVIEGRCAFEQLDLEARPELADELLRVRSALEVATPEQAHTVRRRFYRLLNESRGD